MNTFDWIGLLGFLLSLALAVSEFIRWRPRVDIHAPSIYVYRRSKHSEISLIADLVLVSRSSRPVSITSVLVNGIACEANDHVHCKVRASNNDGEGWMRSLCTAGMPLTLQPYEARRIRVEIHVPPATLERSLVESRAWTYTRHSFFSEVELPPAEIPSIALFGLGLRTNCSALFRRRLCPKQECQLHSLGVLLDDLLRDP